MSEFKEIKTQEEFDALIKERLERERKTRQDKYSDYDDLKKKNEDYSAEITKLNQEKKDFESKTADYDKQINELNSKVKGYETDSAKTRIALEKGLPYAMAKRLNGTTVEEIEKDADEMVKYMGKQDPAPYSSNEPQAYSKEADKERAFKELAQKLSTK